MAWLAAGQANGKLQIHFIDVGQGDAALIVSPNGETVLVDNGIPGHCDMPLSYLEEVGVKKLDYMIISHYHNDHMACSDKVVEKFPLQHYAYDRGGTSTLPEFKRYVAAVGNKRKTAEVGEKIILDAGPAPVTIEFVAMNGAGVETTNENDLSLVAVVRFGKFDAVLAGDLSGYDENEYRDIETTVAPKVGQVEVYKVNHHCSRYSTNEAWIRTIHPRVAVISASGNIGRKHQHPTIECLERLHAAGVKTYWTEKGGGAPPEEGLDVVGKNIVVEAAPGGSGFTVTWKGSHTDTYEDWEGASAPVNPTYSWTKSGDTYHYSDCKVARGIKAANLVQGDTPPPGRHLHAGCPK